MIKLCTIILLLWLIRVDLEKERIRIKVWLPFLHMTANYTIEGRILMLPISGAGLSEGNYSKPL